MSGVTLEVIATGVLTIADHFRAMTERAEVTPEDFRIMHKQHYELEQSLLDRLAEKDKEIEKLQRALKMAQGKAEI